MKTPAKHLQKPHYKKETTRTRIIPLPPSSKPRLSHSSLRSALMTSQLHLLKAAVPYSVPLPAAISASQRSYLNGCTPPSQKTSPSAIASAVTPCLHSFASISAVYAVLLIFAMSASPNFRLFMLLYSFCGTWKVSPAREVKLSCYVAPPRSPKLY